MSRSKPTLSERAPAKHENIASVFQGGGFDVPPPLSAQGTIDAGGDEPHPYVKDLSSFAEHRTPNAERYFRIKLRPVWFFGQAILLILVIFGPSRSASGDALFEVFPEAALRNTPPIRCVAFSPYVSGTNPDTGPHPPAALIDTLLDVVRTRAGFNCILTYGLLNGLDYVIDAAHTRGMKVIAGIWLDTDPAVNTASITAGIAKAKQYPETILRLSCGVELRNRRGGPQPNRLSRIA
jgi:hypothetical protein